MELEKYVIKEKSGNEIMSVLKPPREVKELREHLDDDIIVETVDKCVHDWRGVQIDKSLDALTAEAHILEQCNRCNMYRKREIQIE